MWSYGSTHPLNSGFNISDGFNLISFYLCFSRKWKCLHQMAFEFFTKAKAICLSQKFSFHHHRMRSLVQNHLQVCLPLLAFGNCDNRKFMVADCNLVNLHTKTEKRRGSWSSSSLNIWTAMRSYHTGTILVILVD